MNGQDFTSMRRLMVSNQLRPNAISDIAVLAAMGAVARERFVGDASIGAAYRDGILPLGNGRAINPALATARLIQAARVQPDQHVLVVGAATGYVAAVYRQMGASVTALEEDAGLLARARAALAGDPGIEVVEGPLAAGWPNGVPYAVIHIDGAIEQVPRAIVEQIAQGGVLVCGIADGEIAHLVEGRHVASGFGTASIADIDMAPLPGFAPAPAFAF